MTVRARMANLVLCALAAVSAAWAQQPASPEARPVPPAAPTPAVTIVVPPPGTSVPDAPSPETAVPPARLVVFNREIATLRARVLGFGPGERAAAAVRRIDEQTDRDVYGGVTVEPAAGGTYAIEVAGKWMLFVTPGDVDPMSGDTVEGLARAAAGRLQEALAALRDQRSLPRLARSVGITVGALIALLALLRLIRYLARVSRLWLRRLVMRRDWQLTVLGVRLLDRLRLQRGVRFTVTLVARAAALVLAYLWVVIALYQFPYSRPWSGQANAFILDNAARLAMTMLGTIPGLFVVALVLIVTRWLVGVAGAFFDLIENGRIALPWLHPDVAQPTRRLFSAFLWVLAIVVAYPFIPFSESVAFKGVSVLIGLMVSLGSSGVVSQAMSGLVLMYSRALRAGEYVRIGDTEGTVTALGILSTKIRTPKGEEVTIPNSVVVGTTTKNYSRLADARELLLYTSVTIGYDAPWRQVHELLIRAAERTEGLAATPRPFVLQTALSDFYVEYQINAKMERPEERPAVLSRLHVNIQDLFNEYGVQIMSPHYLGDPQTPKVVPKEQWFAPPARSENPPGKR